MVDIANIKDKDSFRKWLTETNQPQQVCVWLAHRAAMRILPVYWDWVVSQPSDRDLTTIPILRASLISGVAAVGLTPEIKEAADAATAAARAAADAADAATAATDAAYAVARAATAAADAAYAAAADATVAAYATVARAATAADAATAAAWASIRNDCEIVAQGIPERADGLWLDRNPLEPRWKALAQRLPTATAGNSDVSAKGEAAEDWSFWTQWYQRALDGTETRWDMLRDIALLPNNIWEADFAILTRAIEGIQLRYAADEYMKSHPLAVRYEINPRNDKVSSHPKEKKDLCEVVKLIRMALREFLSRCRTNLSAGSKEANIAKAMLEACQPQINSLRKKISRFQSCPDDLHRELRGAIFEFQQITKVEGFLPNSPVGRLVFDLNNCRAELCSADDDLLEQEKRRSKVELALATNDQLAATVLAARGLENESEGVLQMAIVHALSVVADHSSSEDAKTTAYIFLAETAPPAARERIRNQVETDRPTFLERAAEMGDKLTKADKAIDVIQELSTEGVGWAQYVMALLQNGKWPWL